MKQKYLWDLSLDQWEQKTGQILRIYHLLYYAHFPLFVVGVVAVRVSLE